MTEMKTMIRTSIEIDGDVFALAQGDVVDQLASQVEEASRSGARFVTFTVVGNRTVRALITPTTRVIISVESVQFDPRDDGDLDKPFGSHFDDFS
ncbi:hypothetical protein [Microbacterium thalli]|uniref:hypothetical protein n=1 Tax=Microbacterium thalli TaxID=3027921 RepID=UPI0023650C7B|nr:hypothetical protein [Microbacterium thalli]MDD7929910.1 hypothetical protein [Microbacterium thalli]